MSGSHLVILIALSAIWGSSFLFLRIGAPALGPILLIELRVGLAALFLLFVGLWLRTKLDWRVHWRHYLFLGAINAALPFVLFAFAARTLPASLLSILNATAPMWGAIIGIIWAKQNASAKSVLGLFIGALGVAILVGFDTANVEPGASVAIIAVLAATCCYGIGSHYTKRADHVAPMANAQGSMWAATLLLVPLTVSSPIPSTLSYEVAVSVLLLGILCTGAAMVLWFKLIAEVPATSALSVTFLIPVFGVFWGHTLLDEPIGWHTLIGAITVLSGTAMVTGFNPRALLLNRRRARNGA